jgi:hypothetical protein
VFHSYDVNSEEKLRYKLGVVIFFMMFLALYSIQIYVMIDGFMLYYKWRQLMIPSKKAIELSLKDSSFKTEAQMRLEAIRARFSPEINKMNIIFVYLQFSAVIRFVAYSWIRFSSQQAFTDWVQIKDEYFLITYMTELWITIGLFAFLFEQIMSKMAKESRVKDDQLRAKMASTDFDREDSLVHVMRNSELGPGVVLRPKSDET